MTERLPCQTPGCAATILPTTALKTGGICMPCHQKKLALEEKAYILQNRKDVDRYAGKMDPVEILKMMHAPRKYNPLENDLPYHKSAQELYHQLTEAELELMEIYAITLIDREDLDQAETILLSLVCFTNARIERGLEAFLQKGKYYPSILYKDAGSAIRDDLIHRVDNDSANRNHLLLALAWIDDEEVIRLFAKWRQNPPRWASELYVPQRTILLKLVGNWITTVGSGCFSTPRAINLFICGEGIGGAEPAQSAVMALKTHDQVCPWCDGKLMVLFDYNLKDPLVGFMKLSGQQLRIAACMHCNCYGTVFMKVDLDGGYSWSEYNTVPDFLPETEPNEEFTLRALQLSERLMGTYEGAEWTLEAPTSQIGGHPAWIQDAEYPTCPCCSDTMMFIGQLDMEQVAASEGIYYTFLCEACLIAAVNYQQS
jgi:hypothetical protein